MIPFRVFVVDDHPAVRDGLASRIQNEPDLVLCGEATTVAEAWQRLTQLQPDVAIIDLTLKESSGLELIRDLRAAGNPIHILVWSMHNESLFAEQAIQAGANGFINKEEPTELVIEAIRNVAQGTFWLSPKQTQRILDRSILGKSSSPDHQSLDSLTDRELQVLKLYGEGAKTAEIAQRLNISKKTVSTHQSHLIQKLNLSSSIQLVHFATKWLLQQKLVP